MMKKEILQKSPVPLWVTSNEERAGFRQEHKLQLDLMKG